MKFLGPCSEAPHLIREMYLYPDSFSTGRRVLSAAEVRPIVEIQGRRMQDTEGKFSAPLRAEPA